MEIRIEQRVLPGAANGSVAGVVGMAGEDGEGAVDLLGQDDACELVGEGDAAEGEQELGTSASYIRPAVGGPDGEDETLRPGVAKMANGLSNLFGGELTAAAVEQGKVDGSSAGLAIEPGEECGFGIEEH
jgi:hypothetical protein